MAKKKKQRYDGIIYSTNDNFDYEFDEVAEDETLPPVEQDLRILLDRKIKGGKHATKITGFVGKDEDLKALGKRLKQLCGAGGSTKEGIIIIQGDFREKVSKELQKQGYRFKFSGG